MIDINTRVSMDKCLSSSLNSVRLERLPKFILAAPHHTKQHDQGTRLDPQTEAK